MKKYILTFLFAVIATAMSAQTQKAAMIHLKSGEVQEVAVSDIDSITFCKVHDLNFEAKYVRAAYYGDGQYWVILSDAPISDTQQPTQAGQSIAAFYCCGDASENSNQAILPTGTYDGEKGSQKGGIYTGELFYTYVMYCTGMTDDGQPKGFFLNSMATAKADVTYADGNYNISLHMALGQRNESEGFKETNVTYNGPISFINMDPNSYSYLTEDVSLVPTMNGAYHMSNADDGYSFYSFTFSNRTYNSSGYATGAGAQLSIELATDYTSPMDLTKLIGTYNVAPYDEKPYTPGTFLSGKLDEIFGMTIPAGTYYMTYDSNGVETRTKGFATGGTVTISEYDDNILRVKADITMEGGHKLTMNSLMYKSSFIDYDNEETTTEYVKENPVTATSGMLPMPGFKSSLTNIAQKSPMKVRLFKAK